jgi:hypothetical protein
MPINLPKLTIEMVPTNNGARTSTSSSRASAGTSCARRPTAAPTTTAKSVAGGVRHAVEAHEVWLYDEIARVQRLVRLVVLCSACHEVKHLGLAGVHGRMAKVLTHRAEVNGWTKAEVEAHAASERAAWSRRNAIDWALDLSVLAEYGIEPPSQRARWRAP